ncbi:hypothetical protein IWW36_002794 [Coemansia brasiliensis]|uniref:PH domain-containing protein n=1 Tax=Coemansia brasiliensis TaxID=2650707 RepID=A0A9W8I6L8_9FUNG|nr:hypothetical protein IWW36_002794 [Coemansia brasiliensis]
MASTASSAIPLPASEATSQPTEGKPVLTFSPSTKFPETPSEHHHHVESDDGGGSDPDDLVATQLDSIREKLYRDKARDAIKKEQVHMEGFLYKKAGSGASKAWNKRWCVLRSQALLIYKHLSESKLKRIIRADEIVDVRHVDRRNHSFVFEVETPERSFYFEASSEQELDTWLRRLRAVVAAINSSSDAASVRRSSDSRHAAIPRNSAADTFSSLPNSSSRRAQDTTTSAQAIFIPNDRGEISTLAAERISHPGMTRMPSTPTLRIDTGRTPADPIEIGSALPPGINPGHEPIPVLDTNEYDEDEEPNFTEDQRREIEQRLLEDRVILRGYLLKQDKLRQWRRRWFVLRQNTLSYYHDDKEYQVKQILRRHDIYDVRAPDPSTAKAKSLHRTYFKLVAAKRNYWLAHDDSLVAREWFNSLRMWNDASNFTNPPAKQLMNASTTARSAPSRPLGLGLLQSPRVYSPATSPAYHQNSPMQLARQTSTTALDPSQ